MANYSQLKTAIAAVIRTNNRNEITGQLLQNVLFEMTGSIGENMQLAGFADPLTDPHEPDQNLFYLAEQSGVYTHFDNIILDGGLSFLMWKNGSWTSRTVGVVTQQWVSEHYVSIEFFRSLFRAYDEDGVEIMPNNEAAEGELPAVVENIKAMVGMWTEQYMSALGRATGGSGGGGVTSLSMLDDVSLSEPLTDGQALIYDALSQKWVNGSAGVDMTAVWSALAGATGEQINLSHLTTALTDYATQAWVEQNYISVAYFDRLFRPYNGNTQVQHNDTTSTIDNIKAMFGFWTEMYLSALGRDGNAMGLELNNLNDVLLSSPAAGDVLTYDAVAGKWVNQQPQAGVTSLSALSDVALSSITDGQVLMYVGNSQRWVNTGLKTINGYSIFGSGNINISGGVSGNYMFINERGALNANNCYANAGLYMIVSGSNLPSGSQYGALLFLPYRAGVGNSSPDFAGQIFIPNGDDATNPNGMYYRTSIANSWNSWQEVISNRGGQTINDSLKVAMLKIEGNNEINSYNSNNAIWLNYRVNGNVMLCHGGGNVGVGYDYVSDAEYLFDVNGDARAEGCFFATGNDKGFYAVSPNASERYMFGATGSGFIWGSVNGTYLRFLNGNVGVKTISPSYSLHVAGTIYATGAITALSDIRKKDIKDIDTGLTIEHIAIAPTIKFLWKDRKEEGLQVGSIAQYWQTVLPEVVSDKGGELSMQYGVAALVSSIVTARKVVDHERRITELEKENERLRTELEQIRLN